MDFSSGIDSNNTGLVLSASFVKERQISIPKRMVNINKPVALHNDEQAFIEKTLHYISSIRGAIKSDLVLSTNTIYPKRYVVIIRGLPMMTLEDIKNIRHMNDSIRNITISMEDGCIRIDVWRKDKRVQASRKRRRRQLSSSLSTCKWDLSSVDTKDRQCLNIFLNRLSLMEGIECQFNISIDTSEPDIYNIDFQIMDSLKFKALENILHECRTFCRDFEFNFPNKTFRAKCLRVEAPLYSQINKRRRLTIK